MVKHKLAGEMAQTLTCQLDQGQAVYSESGTFRWKTPNVDLETRLSAPKGAEEQAKQSGGGGFLGKALATATEVGKRALAGDSLAFQWFRPLGGSGLVTFAGELPGQIRVLELDGSHGWKVQRGGFVCAEEGVAFDIAMSGLMTGHRSGEGLIMQHFTGSGTLVVAGGGTLTELNPSDYGGKLQLHAGALVAFADSVDYSVERVGNLDAKTLMTAAFGGAQSLYLVTLTGSGPVLVQAMLHRTLEEEAHRDRGEQRGGGLLDRL